MRGPIPRCEHCGGLTAPVRGYDCALCECRSARSGRLPVNDRERTAFSGGRSKIERIRELTAAGKTAREIAAEIDCSVGYVHSLRSKHGIRPAQSTARPNPMREPAVVTAPRAASEGGQPERGACDGTIGDGGEA